MSGSQFLAIAPRGEFDVEVLEVITAKDGTALVRIIHGGRALAVRIPTATLQDQVALLQRPDQIRTTGARVLFSPLPGPTDEASGVTSSDPASSPAAAAPAEPPRVTPGDLARFQPHIVTDAPRLVR